VTLADARCLDLLEQGLARHPLDRALLLAAQADASQPWADVPLGVRDAQLVALRSAWFGPEFQTVLRCESCGEMLSATLDLRSLPPAPATCEVRVGGQCVRLPTTRDLAALAERAGALSEDDAAAAALCLLKRLTDPTPDEPDTAHAGAVAMDAALDAALEAADPLAHVEVELTCERCGHRHARALDIAACLWDDVQAQGERVLAEVDALASAYGWNEGEILSMPSTRRRLYMERLARREARDRITRRPS
jgi:hypothetical protein